MDPLVSWGMVAGGFALTGILASAVGLTAPRVSRRRQIRDLKQELQTLADEYRPRRHYTRCHCGRFARKIAGGRNWYEYECAAHGHGWHAEKLIGEFERPARVTVEITRVPRRSRISSPPPLAISAPRRQRDWLDIGGIVAIPSS